MEAINTLYSPKIVAIEAMARANMPASDGRDRGRQGKGGVVGKRTTQSTSAEINGPLAHGDRFIVRMKMDVTAKAGLMAGKRTTMDEGCLYTVKDGKIVHEESFKNYGSG